MDALDTFTTLANAAGAALAAVLNLWASYHAPSPWLRPQDKRAWADLGVTTDRHGGELGAGLFNHAGIVAVAA